jgi:hypothetical protein
MACIISQGDKYKTIIKIAMGWARKKLGAQVDVVHSELETCGNPVFSRIAQILNEASDKVEEKYQQKMIREVGELFLWILYKDTAYRDVAFWMLKQMFENSEDFEKELALYAKNPEDWYVNVWHRTKMHTKELRAEGKISEMGKSFDEEVFTPPIQAKRLKKYK